jgi:hypothetical protein
VSGLRIPRRGGMRWRGGDMGRRGGDMRCRHVIDGSAVGANLGVNSSVAIADLAEGAMRFIPEKQAATRS